MELAREAFQVEPWADSYVGTPYKPNGRDVKTGVDCWGLVSHVMRVHYRLAIPNYDSLYVTPADHSVLAAATAADSWTLTPFEGRQKGDGLWFRSLRGIAHVGVMVSRNDFLHCNIGVAACLGRATDPFWRSRIEGVYRWEGPTLE